MLDDKFVVGFLLIGALLGLFTQFSMSDSVGEVNSGLEKKPNIVLVSVESMRSQNIGPCYGYERATASEICGLAEDGVLFKQAYSQGTSTTVSTPSLITGELPVAVARNNLTRPLLEGAVPVTQMLEDRGYSTVGLFDTLQGKLIESPLANSLGEIHGWKTYNRSKSGKLIQENEPAFIWAFSRNTTHKPYVPHSKARSWDNLGNIRPQREIIASESELENSNLTRQDIVDLYDESILTADTRIGTLIDSMKEEGVYRDSMIIVTGNMGELFGYKGNYGHGHRPYEPEISVPLVIKFPENSYAGRTVETPVRHIDVVPTIQQYTGMSVKDEVAGESLLKILREDESSREVISAQFPTREYSISINDTKKFVRNPAEYCIYEEPHRGGFKSIDNDEELSKSLILDRFCDAYSKGYEKRFENQKSKGMAKSDE